MDESDADEQWGWEEIENVNYRPDVARAISDDTDPEMLPFGSIKVEPNSGESSEEDRDETPIIQQERSALANTASLDPDKFQLMNEKGTFCFEDISPEEEFWFIQCPTSLSNSDLQNAKIKFGESGKKSKFMMQHNGEMMKYTCSNLAENPKETLILFPTSARGSMKAELVPVVGHLALSEKLPVIKLKEELITETEITIEHPPIKCRHPLLGSDYKNVLNKIETARRRRELFEQSNPPKKHKKEKSHKRKHSNESKGDFHDKTTPEKQDYISRKDLSNKKKEHNLSIHMLDQSTNKHKRKSHHDKSFSETDSNIQETEVNRLRDIFGNFMRPSQNHRPIDDFNLESITVNYSPTASPERELPKKKKKNKHEKSTEFSGSGDIESQLQHRRNRKSDSELIVGDTSNKRKRKSEEIKSPENRKMKKRKFSFSDE